ncbi:MAG: lipopolysaccharide transport periplasmic protein LptA [Gammaproteobacteria bacterium]|nr:lipopolysaccharide transport periplasmic protein LptA [Gammaproteobacteria bacterium]MDH5778817.1 lipopolysaccharide transport periplasmic protein LptA [Gammaproteobacteria bacterium]
MKFLLNSIFITFSITPWMTSHALESDRSQPIFIKANHVEIDKQKGFSTYSGNVSFSQGSIKIQGDQVTMYYKNGELDKAVVKGRPALFQQQPDKGNDTVVSQAKTLEYYARSSRLFLLDKAEVSQGANSFAGARIEYDIHRSTVVANNNNSTKGRINAILAPAPENKDANTIK